MSGTQYARAAAYAVLTAVTLAVLAAVLPAALGWRSAVVLTGSMSPAVDPGDVVVFEPIRAVPPVGSIVLIRAATGAPITHRVAGETPDGLLVTKGDANRAADGAVPLTALEGKARAVVPWVGRIRLLGTPEWRSALPLPALLLAAVATLMYAPARSSGNARHRSGEQRHLISR